MELQVTVTLSDRLFDLLEGKLPNLGRRVERAITKEIGAQVRSQSEIRVEALPTESDKPRHARRTKPEAESPEAIAPEVQVEPEASQPAEAQQEYRPMVDGPAIEPEKELTEEDIRAAMHRTRQRIEGENYKDNPNSEPYKKHHKALTAQFKQIAMQLCGIGKPSALPADKRAAFIAECDAIILDENGLVAPPPAPF